MTEHGTLFYIEKILTFALVCAFCYMLYIISVCWLPVRESHYLLVVQWCRNDDSNTHYAKNLSWHGLYVYLEKSSGNIIVREMNTPLQDPFQPYRYVYRKIAHENDISLVAEKWGVIKCQEKNKALIGSSGYSFLWGHDQ